MSLWKSLWMERPYELKRYYALLRETDKCRLARQAQEERLKEHKIWSKAMSWIGSHLSAWGKRMQVRYGTAVTGFPSVRSHSGGEPIFKGA